MKSKLSMSKDITGNWDDAAGNDEIDTPLERSTEASV
jgi:hypothetical protein